MILELLSDSGTVTGVDVAGHRLAACRTLLQKYALGDRCRLFVGDGTQFSLIPAQISADTKPSSKRESILWHNYLNLDMLNRFIELYIYCLSAYDTLSWSRMNRWICAARKR